MPIGSLTDQFTFDGAKKPLTAKSPVRNLNVFTQELSVASFKQRWIRRDGRLCGLSLMLHDTMSKENCLLLLLGHGFLKLFTLKRLKIKYYNEIIYTKKN